MTTQPKPPVEVVPGQLVTRQGVIVEAQPIAVAVQPTQVRRPWQSTVRTVFQAFIALCVMAPFLVTTAGLDPAALPWLAGVLAIAAGVTRVMALPQVEAFLRRFVPWLAAGGR